MNANILQLYKQATDMRGPWVNRWTACQRYTLPTADDESATLFDGTVGDAVENMIARDMKNKLKTNCFGT